MIPLAVYFPTNANKRFRGSGAVAVHVGEDLATEFSKSKSSRPPLNTGGLFCCVFEERGEL